MEDVRREARGTRHEDARSLLRLLMDTIARPSSMCAVDEQKSWAKIRNLRFASFNLAWIQVDV